jgi:hypothetical protein
LLKSAISARHPFLHLRRHVTVVDVANDTPAPIGLTPPNGHVAGGSVVEAMTALPGVTIAQDGELQLPDRDKVAVLIDGKKTALTGAGSQSGLENLPASALASIGIITTRPAGSTANATRGHHQSHCSSSRSGKDSTGNCA